MAFGKQQLWVLVLHSAGPHRYLTLLSLVQWHLEDDSYLYLYYILLDYTLFFIIYALIGSFAFGRRELCVLVLYSTGPDNYLTQL